MRQSRLNLALEGAIATLPDTGRIAVFAPRADEDLSDLPRDRVQIVQGFKPDHDVWAGRGFDCSPVAKPPFSAAMICLPRAKALARALVAAAVAGVAGGPVIVDGQKTDGIDSLLKECRKRAEITGVISKAHGKLFCMTAAPDAFAEWAVVGPTMLPDGYQTLPGVFSADGVDRGSALLAAALPAHLKGRVADLGAGWGYLAAQALTCDGIRELHLVEADHDALSCAKLNVQDPRARFHWADATTFRGDAPFDVVITNPPFHTGRAADPALGLAFLQNAATILAPSGQLWLVANRQLPYERGLAELFREVDEVAGDSGFKILHATRPIQQPRRRR